MSKTPLDPGRIAVILGVLWVAIRSACNGILSVAGASVIQQLLQLLPNQYRGRIDPGTHPHRLRDSPTPLASACGWANPVVGVRPVYFGMAAVIAAAGLLAFRGRRMLEAASHAQQR